MSPTLRIILVYGVLIGVVLSMLRVLELLYLTGRLNLDLYIGAVALIFLLGGVHVGTTWQRTRVFRASARADFETNGLSPRELQVLEHIAEGASNREIAVGLHVSTNTVKTHINHLYAKIGVNRRTQAVARARSLGLIRKSPLRVMRARPNPGKLRSCGSGPESKTRAATAN